MPQYPTHCRNCGRKCYFKAGYKYEYCQNNPECKRLHLAIFEKDPKHKEHLKQYFSTKNGKEMHRRAKQKYRHAEKGREARRRERYNAEQKKKAQKLAEKVQIHAMRKMMRVWDGRATILILVFLVAL